MVQVSPVIVYFFMTVFEKKTIEEATWLLSSSVCVLELVIFRLNFEYLQSGISRLCTQLLHRTMCLLLNRTKSYHLYASFHGVMFWRRSENACNPSPKNCHNTPYTLNPLNKGRDRINWANAAITIIATRLMRIVHRKTITALGAVIPKVLKVQSTKL